MSALLTLLLAVGAAANTCVTCHADVDFTRDIHKEKGLSCVSCHGGDSTKEDMGEAMDPAKGFVGKPAPAEVAQFCGKCHSDPAYMRRYNPSLPTDQAAKYATSNHGLRLKGGNLGVATCVSCHPAHSMRPPKDPTSSVYVKNVADTCARCHTKGVVAEFKESVHGKALLERGDTSAPTCNTCHGNHGAAPPGVASIGQVCGSCHVNNADFFKASPMAKTWEKKGFHACATCHTAHAVKRPSTALLAGDEALCARCHKPGSQGMRVASTMKSELDGTKAAFDAALAAVGAAEEKGLDMADARDSLSGAKMALYLAHTSVHSFSPETVAKPAGESKAASAKAQEAAKAAVLDFRNRRVGLGLSTFVIAFLAGALYLKLRDYEAGQ